MSRSRGIIAVAAFVLCLAPIVVPSQEKRASRPPGPNRSPSLSMVFEQNSGQTDPRVKFLARGSGFTLFLTAREAVIRAGSRTSHSAHIVRMRFPGQAEHSQIDGLEEWHGRLSYFIGSDPSKWRADVPTFSAVAYRGLYPGVDLIFRGTPNGLEYQFRAAPGADPSVIHLAFTGVGPVHVSRSGDLLLPLGSGFLVHRRPVAYQVAGSDARPVNAQFVKVGPRDVAFSLGPFSRSDRLVIDPTLVFSTFFGGSGYDALYGLALDATGAAYISGETESVDFPVKNPIQPLTGGQDAFVAKLSPGGSSVVYATYLGGSSREQATGISVDGQGNAYATGYTQSTDFPTVNPFQASYQGGQKDAFVAKLNPTGTSLVYSTYLGGEGEDWASDVTADQVGDAYVTGYTYSYLFPLKNPIPLEATLDNAFVTEFRPDGRDVVYSTQLGGYSTDPNAGSSDYGNDVAVDAAGAAYVVGSTEATVFPTKDPFQPVYGGGETDAFVSKIQPRGGALIYSTYLGGSEEDAAHAVAIDSLGNAYVAGYTDSPADFPTFNAIEECNRGFRDAFVTKLNPSGSEVAYSTYLGGDIGDRAGDIAVDSSGHAFVAGGTTSFDFPVLHPAQRYKGGDLDTFVVELTPGGSKFLYSTFLGGSDNDYGSVDTIGIALDAHGRAYVAGGTVSSNFPTVRPLQAELAGGFDAFVATLSSSTQRPGSFHRGCVPPLSFADYQIYSMGSRAQNAAIGDVTGDGRNDVLVTTSNLFGTKDDYKLFVFPQLPDGSLGHRLRYQTHCPCGEYVLNEWSVATGDLNGDGLADAAETTPVGVDLYIQQGGVFLPPKLLRTDGRATGIAIKDVDGDGAQDMVVSTERSVSVYKNAYPSFTPIAVASTPQLDIDTGDVTGDGRLDIIGLTNLRMVHVFPQQVDGSFGPSVDYQGIGESEYALAYGLEVADVTSDGRLDVIISLDNNTPNTLINVFAQDRAGKLSHPAAYGANNNPEPVEALDMNGDGHVDLVTANGGWQTVNVFLQDPEGSFGAYSYYAIDPNSIYPPQDLALGDISGDGLPDIVLAGYNSGLMVIRQLPAPRA